MLSIIIPGVELYDENKSEFVYTDDVYLDIEHSLLSISKWESRWCKPFISDTNKTVHEIVDYVKCMTLNSNVSEEVYNFLTDDNIQEINMYIELPMTATTFSNTDKSGKKEIITSELIYYWMITYNIPFECSSWHLNRLLTLIKVCNIKNSPPTKMSEREIHSRNRNINAERRKQLHSKG